MGELSGAPRWFIALSIAAPERLLARLGPPPEPLRVFAATDLHVTLAFLGNCATEEAERAWSLASGRPPPQVATTVTDARLLGVPSAPSAWSLVLAESSPLSAWVARQAPALRALAGRPPEPRPFLPHLTLARRALRDPGARERVLEWLRTLTGCAVEFTGVGLFRRAPAGGPQRYLVHARRTLVA